MFAFCSALAATKSPLLEVADLELNIEEDEVDLSEESELSSEVIFELTDVSVLLIEE